MVVVEDQWKLMGNWNTSYGLHICVFIRILPQVRILPASANRGEEMNDTPIKSIYGTDPPNGDDPFYHTVGKFGVTKITESVGGDLGKHFHIWQGEHLHSIVFARALSEIRFFDPKEVQ